MNENTTNPMLLYSEVIIIKIYKNLLPLWGVVVECAASCSSQDKQGLGLDKNWLWAVCSRSHLAASGGSVAQGRADDQYYQGVSSNGINHVWRLSNRGGSRNEMCLSPVRKRWESQWSLMLPCRSLFRSPAWNLTRHFISFFFYFPRVMWNYDSSW